MAQQKRIKPGNLELNVEEQAIIAHYTTEVTSLEPDGQRLSTESRPGKKTIAIKNLSQDSASLAQEIVDKCKYIPATRLREVEQMVERLRQIKDQSGEDSMVVYSTPRGGQRLVGCQT